MIGLGPHEMDAWLWAFDVGLTVAFVLMAALSIGIALRTTGERRRSTGQHGYPRVVRASADDAERHGRDRSGS